MTRSVSRLRSGVVRLRSVGVKGTGTGVLTVPNALMGRLWCGTLFKPEITDDGILYRYVGDATASQSSVAQVRQP